MKNTTKLLGIIALMALIAGFAGAQEIEVVPETFDFSHGIYFNTMPQLDLLSDGEQKAPIGGIAVVAGLMNMPLGLWSWLHQDWLGGGITAGLMVGGIALVVYGVTRDTDDLDDTMGAMAIMSIGSIFIIASPIYGFFRGMKQFRRLKAASLAEALNENPLNNIMLVVLPTFDENRVMGSFTYSISF